MYDNHHMREVLIFFFQSMKAAAKAHRELQTVYEDISLSKTTCRDWFRCFKDGDFDVVVRSREERRKTYEDTELTVLLDGDPCQKQVELASKLAVTR